MAKCPNCGRDSPDQARFCRSCGTPFPADGAGPAAPPGGTPEQRAQRLLEEAFRLSEESRIIGAIQACQQAITINPNSVSAHSLLGTLYERQGDRDAAIREYEQVLTLSPESTVERRRLNELMGVPTAREGVRISVRTARLALTGGGAIAVFMLVAALLYYTQQAPPKVPRPKAPAGAIAQGPGPGPSAAGEMVPVPGRRFNLSRLPAAPPTPAPETGRAPGGGAPGGRAPAGGAQPRQAQLGQWVAPGTYLLPNPTSPPAYRGVATRPPSQEVPAPPVAGAVPYQGTPVIPTPSFGPPEGMRRTRAAASQQRARDYYFTGDYNRAISAYRSYLSQNPQAGAGTREELAWVYAESGNRREAADEYRSALKQYQADLDRGHNVEAARHGIRACEAAIRALEGR